VKLVNDCLTIRGEKREEKEEKKKDYCLHERHFGSFERRFALPEGVDPNKIEATFKKGVLTVTLAKKLEAQRPETKIEVKARLSHPGCAQRRNPDRGGSAFNRSIGEGHARGEWRTLV
jgi:Hsp20/alpha crystallin family protein